jgi:hypothetical protein
VKSRGDVFAAIAVAVLLLLTAWGNATAMMVVSAIGLVIGAVLFRGRTASGGILVATTGFAVAGAIAIDVSEPKSLSRWKQNEFARNDACKRGEERGQSSP